MEKPIGEILSQWKVYLTNISRNLMELSEQTDYKLIKLKAKDTTNGYTGITKVKAVQCVECLDTLWQYYALLAEAIDKAIVLNNKDSFLFDTEKDARKILNSAYIVVERERINVNNRSLISGENQEKKMSSEQLLKYMQDSFESLCKDITEISKATEGMKSRLSAMKTEISRLNSTVKALNISSLPMFDIEKVTALERDPLQGSLELDMLVYKLEKFRASIKAVETEYSNTVQSLKKVSSMLLELKELAEKSKQVVIDSQQIFTFTSNIKPIISEDVLKSLQDWHQVLNSKLTQGELKAVKIGALKLEQECSLKLEREKENYYSNSKDYNELLDLKGHFKALLAKAEILKTKGLLWDNSLSELIENTRTALYGNVISLENCRQLVRVFELSLKS